jgi:hypothetical protein
MPLTQPLDCVCVIHGDFYDFRYVEILYSMLKRQLIGQWRFTVFTESERSVPDYMRKIPLEQWSGVTGRRSAWWYKMQIFDPQHGLGQVLYLDLDVVIIKSLAWILELDPRYFWTLRDFRYLWNTSWFNMNSSLMYFDHQLFAGVYQEFCQQGLDSIRSRHSGDQDWLQSVIPTSQKRFVETARVQSWRWQTWEGGIDTRTKKTKRPGSGAVIDPNTAILVFHGQPKPHQIDCTFVTQHWH